MWRVTEKHRKTILKMAINTICSLCSSCYALQNGYIGFNYQCAYIFFFQIFALTCSTDSLVLAFFDARSNERIDASALRITRANPLASLGSFNRQ